MPKTPKKQPKSLFGLEKIHNLLYNFNKASIFGDCLIGDIIMSNQRFKQRIHGSSWSSYDDPGQFRKDAVFRSDIIKNYVKFPYINVYQIGYCYHKANRQYLNHVTKRYKLVYVLEGSGWFNGMPVKSGQGFLMWEKHVNSMSADVNAPWGYIYVSFTGSMAEQLLTHAGFTVEDSVFDIDDMDTVRSLCMDVIYNKHPELITDVYLLSILFQLISLNKNQLDKQEHVSSGPLPGMSEHVSNAIQYMSKNYRSPIGVADVVNAAHVSEKYLRQLFKVETGKSILQYLNDLRLTAASSMLSHSRYNVSEIASLAGFKEYRNFERLFKARYGITPTKFRAGIPNNKQ